MKHLLILILALLSFQAFPQDSTMSLNLNQCIEIALKNSLDIGRKTIYTENTRLNWQQERANLLPSVNAGVTHGLNMGRSINPLTNTYVTDKVAYANPYISGSLLLFNGMAQQNAIKQYALLYRAAREEELQAKNELSLKVVLAYLEVLTNQGLLDLAKSRQQTTLKQLERLNALNQNGAIAPGDYFDLKGQYANDKLSVINSENLLDNSKVELVKLLNIPYQQDLRIEAPNTEHFELNYTDNVKQVYQNAMQNFASLKASELRKKSTDFQVKARRSLHSPSIYFNTGLSSNYADNARNYEQRPISYFDQFGNNLSKSLSISLNIPLFNSFRTRNNISQSKLERQEASLIAQSTLVQLQQLIEQAYFNMETTKTRYSSLKEQAEAYQESFRVAEARFDAGAINTVDYLIARNNFYQAKTSLLTNRYDFISRKKVLDFYQGKDLKL